MSDEMNKRGQRILVTGGAGFIGSNLVRRLCGDGYDVLVVDNFTAGSPRNLDGLPVEVHEGEVRTADEWMPKKIWAVVHLAALTSVPGSVQDPFQDFKANAGGTIRLLRAAAERKVERFVFASSNASLGQQVGAVHEEMLPSPLSPYGASKVSGEAYCLAFQTSYGIETVVLRFANAYGPYSKHKSSVVARFVRAIIAGETLTIYGDGRQGRDFIYVDDICSAILRSLDVGNDVAGQIFQIGTGRETTVRELVSLLSGVVGREVEVEYQPARPGEISRSYSDISKARARLGFVPQVALEQGLKQTIDWFATSPEEP